jgi:predicted Fe-S protein YdhL (DUF1289 family)
MKLTAEANVPAGRALFDEPRSPCVGLCVAFEYRNRRYCYGCGRTIEEIGEWIGANAPRKQEILALAAQRLEETPLD